jgi:metallo-beta-lactamase class B
MLKYLNLLIIGLLLAGCGPASPAAEDKSYNSDNLIIQKISDHAYQHITYLQTETFGRVPCNGVIFFDGKEAVIFDTPADDSTSEMLINWVEEQLHCRVKAIIPTHFHGDCLGGLEAFHKHKIPSYANNATIQLAASHHYAVPQNGFDSLLELTAGSKKIIAEFFGEGHTRDNIVGYFPDEKIMFGGCLIKESGAGKGNLEDANTKDWSSTVLKLKEKYPDTRIVVPGHGERGGIGLLDYTIGLFK